MSQEEIPTKNLPIYLQNYTVSIVSGDKNIPCPSPLLSTTLGKVDYSIIGILPSNRKGDRLWNIKLEGKLVKHDGNYIIQCDFSKIDNIYNIFLNKPASGILNICNRIMDISSIVVLNYCKEDKILSLIIDQSRWGFFIKKETDFSINVKFT